MMQYIELSETLTVSRIIQGLMRLPSWNYDQFQLAQHIEQLVDLGITTFDNADIYGDYTCEKRLGDALSAHLNLRNQIQIVTKCGIKLLSDKYPERQIKYYDTSKAHIISSVNQSLKNMKTDYIDLLLIHRRDPFIDPFEVSEAFQSLYTSGKVLNFGVSNFTPQSFNMLQKFIKYPLVTNQIEVSPLYLTNFDNGTIDLCQEYEIPPMVWSPLAGGNLFSSSSDNAINVCQTLEDIAKDYDIESIDIIAYAFLLSHPVNFLPIIGTKNMKRVKNAIKALDIKLTREEWFRIYVAAKGVDVD